MIAKQYEEIVLAADDADLVLDIYFQGYKVRIDSGMFNIGDQTGTGADISVTAVWKSTGGIEYPLYAATLANGGAASVWSADLTVSGEGRLRITMSGNNGVDKSALIMTTKVED